MIQKQLENGIMAVVIAFIVAIVLLSSAHAQTTNYLFPQPKMQFFDANGNPLNGGKVYTYAAGTTTPLVTCQDSTCSAINTNPVILDSGGYGSIWLSNVGYKLNLKTSADVNVWTVDNISAGCPLNGCSMSGQLSIVTNGASLSAQSVTGLAISGTVTGSSATAIQGSATGSGTSIGIQGIASNASGIAIRATGQNASTQLISGINSAGVEKFAVANTGVVTIGTATGTAPLSITSTTPVANLNTAPVMYAPGGSQLTNAHTVMSDAVLVSGTPSTVTVTLSGSAAFTSSGSYRCGYTNQTTAVNTVKFTYTSGSSFTITGPNTVTDTIGYICIGN
jgi:hypothetical protein